MNRLNRVRFLKIDHLKKPNSVPYLIKHLSKWRQRKTVSSVRCSGGWLPLTIDKE